jgi:SM-20-related protein
MVSALHRIDGFLPEAEVAALLAYAREQQSRFQPSTVGNAHDVDTSFRVSSYLNDLGPFRAPFIDRVMSCLPQMLPSLGIPPFKVHEIQTQLVAHGHGAFYRPHVDLNTGAHRGTGEHDRVVSLVYYFHREPKGFSGGTLRLFPLQIPGTEAGLIHVEPAQNLAVAFSSWQPHEILPVTCPSGEFMDSRFAINCWVTRD